jgi:serine protease Do
MAQERLVPESREEVRLSFAPLVREAAPAVVNIHTSRLVRSRVRSPLYNDPFYRRFFDHGAPRAPVQEEVQNSLGSGVIIRSDGLVVTNHHVIEGADAITVVLMDRREFQADVLVSDDETDLAVLKLVDVEDALPELDLADSDSLEVGDLVLAIGNPFGVGQTVTSGIVSALARTTVGIADYSFFIQTDAAINPGNSGGALVDIDGRLVGINTAIYSRSGGSMGIGFAIPANMVRSVVEGLERGMPLVRPWLGVAFQDVTSDLAEGLELDRPGGVLVTAVQPDSPADEAGLGNGDVILAVNDQPVNDSQALRFRIATLSIGDTARLGIWRRGERQQVPFDVRPPPEDPPRRVRLLDGRHPLAGAVVANLSPALIAEIDFDGRPRRGVVVLEVRSPSRAAGLGLQPLDVVTRIDGRDMQGVEALERYLAQSRPPWRVEVMRGNDPLQATVNR